MKFNYPFALTMVLIILFSLAAVAASENIADNVFLDDALASEGSLGECESEDVLEDGQSSDDVDVSVEVDVENVYQGDNYNCKGYEIPWTVTTMVNEGVAHNVKVHTGWNGSLEYVSSNPTIGTYDSSTKIWDIGDLTSADNATLNLILKVKVEGRLKVSANATTSSNDIDLSNNFVSLATRSGNEGGTSNTTSEGGGSGGDGQSYVPDEHPLSQPEGGFVQKKKDEKPAVREANNHPSNMKNDGQKSRKGEKSDSNSELGSNSVTKTIINDNGVDAITGEVSNPNVNSPANKNKTSFKKDDIQDASNQLPASVVKATSAYDYTHAPMLIFALFLIILVAFAGYNKIKS